MYIPACAHFPSVCATNANAKGCANMTQLYEYSHLTLAPG